jgi:hypothetical protein
MKYMRMYIRISHAYLRTMLMFTFMLSSIRKRDLNNRYRKWCGSFTRMPNDPTRGFAGDNRSRIRRNGQELVAYDSR